MIELGFAIEPRDPQLFAAVMAWAPRTGVPDLSPAEVTTAEHAYYRYEALVGAIDPEVAEGLPAEVHQQDQRDNPSVANSQSIDIDAQLALMTQWSGMEGQKIAAYIYEAIIYDAACGLNTYDGITDWTLEDCQTLISMWHQNWFVPPGERHA